MSVDATGRERRRFFIRPTVTDRRYIRFRDRHALLGFGDEVAGLVEVDVVGDGGAVGIHAGDGAIEDVEVLRGIGRGGIGAGDASDVAEFGEEHLVVRTLGGPGVFPTVMKELMASGGMQRTLAGGGGSGSWISGIGTHKNCLTGQLAYWIPQ